MLFNALLSNLVNPDDGTCQGIDNKMDCVKDTSSYSTYLREQMLLGLGHRDMCISRAVEQFPGRSNYYSGVRSVESPLGWWYCLSS